VSTNHGEERMKKNILVVGASGFLGSNVLQILQETEELNVFTFARDSKVPASFRSIDDLKCSKESFDVVYLLAAYIPYGGFQMQDKKLVTTNIQLVFELCELYPKAKIIFASSVSVYGTPIALPIEITSAFNNPDLYALSKLAGEAIIRNHKQYVIIRFSSLIGIGMKQSTMIPKMIASSLNIGTITIWGNGQRLQNYLDVRDAARLCVTAARLNSNATILGVGNRSYTNLEVARYIQERTHAKIEFVGDDTSPSFVYNVDESYRLLNFDPMYSLQQSINEMIDQI
jgi:UDP-glucose 4-epimerase